MKNKLILLCALLVLASCGKKESKGLLLSGNIEGLKKGTLYIEKLKDTALVRIDSIPINGESKFETDLDIDAPEMLYLILDRGVSQNIDNSLMFFAEPGKMTINTNLELFYANAKITGSKNNDFYQEFRKIKSRYTDQLLELSVAKFNALKENKPFSEEENIAKAKEITKMKYLAAINFAINHKDYEIAPYIALSEISNARLNYLEQIQKALTPKVAKSKYGLMLSKYIAERKRQEALK